jgi:hypothetical protein
MLVNVRDPQQWTYLRNLKEKKKKKDKKNPYICELVGVYRFGGGGVVVGSPLQ